MTAYWLHAGAIVTHVKTPAEQFNAAVGRQLRAEIAAAGSSIAAMSRGDRHRQRSALDNYVTGKRAIPVPDRLLGLRGAATSSPTSCSAAPRSDSAPTAARTGALITVSAAAPMSAADEKISPKSRSTRPSRHDDDTDDLYDTQEENHGRPPPPASKSKDCASIERRRPRRSAATTLRRARSASTPGMSARTDRSVLAHELGHAVLGHTSRRPTPRSVARQERQADEWAARLLITPAAYAAGRSASAARIWRAWPSNSA